MTARENEAGTRAVAGNGAEQHDLLGSLSAADRPGRRRDTFDERRPARAARMEALDPR
jgi:hypothetical protein